MTLETQAGAPRVCAVVVTFRPGSEVTRNIALVAEQATAVLVVDNGSGTAFSGILDSAASLPRTRVIRNSENKGIGAALNLGIQIALSEKFPWIATFDQDSCVPEDYFENILSARARHPFPDGIGIIGPAHAEAAEGARSTVTTSRLVRVAITSGSVIDSRVFGTVGFYDESLFIDYVDFDFCLRARIAGFHILQASGVRLLHRLGSPERRSLLGLKVTIKTHSALRRYYMMRNRVLLYRRYLFRFPGWCLHDFGWLLIELGKIALLESEKWPKLAAVFKGLLHGLAGKTGELRHPA